MGVDLKRFYPSTKKKIDLLFIGAKEEFDGYFLFQDAVKHMKQKAKIQYLIRGENWTSNDRELRELYSSASLVMCFGYNEPFGLIPLEAMACGSAVVAIDEGGHKDSVIDGKTGILVPKDPKRIANVLDNLLLHPEKITAMSKNAFELVKKNWQWKHGAKQILQVYSTLHHRRPTKKLSSKT
jgi:glycosyltransferase involved in cell wall biosynthesis